MVQQRLFPQTPDEERRAIAATEAARVLNNLRIMGALGHLDGVAQLEVASVIAMGILRGAVAIIETANK